MVSHTTLAAGRLQYFTRTWNAVTSNPTVLSWITGYKIPFCKKPPVSNGPLTQKFSVSENVLISNAIKELEALGVVTKCIHLHDHFVSPIFLTTKSNGKIRFILNLKKLNKYVVAPHFKMEDYRTAQRLLAQNFFMTTVDLKDAYFSIPIHPDHRKYLRFAFQNQLYEFTCIPFGLSVAPYCFTKLMKPIVSLLRNRGILCVNYLDDFLVLGESSQICLANTNLLVGLLESLGFIVNREKSFLTPSKCQKFLGFIFNSTNMEIELPLEKKLSIKQWSSHFRQNSFCKIRELARFIGILVSACPAVTYGWLYTKALEREKFLALAHSAGNFEATMSIPSYLHPDLLWWEQGILHSFNTLRKNYFVKEIFTDASLTGWGACCGSEKTYGFWSELDKKSHINTLELRAIFYGLKCFANDFSTCDILLRCDNTTAISYVNRMGSIQYPELCNLTREIWQWCEKRKIWLYASYISSTDNYEADQESRQNFSETEWSLSQDAFSLIVKEFGIPQIDLFASYINNKCTKYVSWHRDPGSFAIDAFTLNWRDLPFYAFPPFNLILRTLQKIIQDKAEGIVVVPFWPSQPWFPLFSRLTIGKNLHLSPSANLLTSPFSSTHPLAPHLSLVVARLSATRFCEEMSPKSQ